MDENRCPLQRHLHSAGRLAVRNWRFQPFTFVQRAQSFRTDAHQVPMNPQFYDTSNSCASPHAKAMPACRNNNASFLTRNGITHMSRPRFSWVISVGKLMKSNWFQLEFECRARCNNMADCSRNSQPSSKMTKYIMHAMHRYLSSCWRLPFYKQCNRSSTTLRRPKQFPPIISTTFCELSQSIHTGSISIQLATRAYGR